MTKGFYLNRWNNTDYIRQKQEKKQRTHIGAKVFRKGAKLFFREIIKKLNRRLKNNLRTPGNGFELPGEGQGNGNQDEHYYPGDDNCFCNRNGETKNIQREYGLYSQGVHFILAPLSLLEKEIVPKVFLE